MRSPCTGLQVLQEVRINFSVQYFDMNTGTEGVSWNVLKQTQTVCQRQIDKFKEA